VTPGETVEYGKYLAQNVANCYGCHTNRDLGTGEFFGEPLAGGLELAHNGKTWAIPNITQGDGSRTKGWNAEGFVARVRTGKPSSPGSPMPWAPYSKMSDQDLRAIWAYVASVAPVDRDTGPSVKP
jgi:mono/diheme cytochrome c family protein